MVDVTSEVRILGSEGPEGLTLRTSGLSARDLPELRVEGLPPYLGQGWARVLAALAQRLAASAEIPERITLDPGIEISLTPAGDGELAPVPPRGRDVDQGLDHWRRDVLLRLFPEART